MLTRFDVLDLNYWAKNSITITNTTYSDLNGVFKMDEVWENTIYLHPEQAKALARVMPETAQGVYYRNVMAHPVLDGIRVVEDPLAHAQNWLGLNRSIYPGPLRSPIRFVNKTPTDPSVVRILEDKFQAAINPQRELVAEINSEVRKVNALLQK